MNMRKVFSRGIACVLSGAMLFSFLTLQAAAQEDALPAGEPPAGAPEGGGTGVPTVDYQTLDILGQSAGIFIKDGVVETNPELIGDSGTITSTEISGTRITADTIGAWNKSNEEDGVAGTSGIVIKNTSTGAAADDQVLIGGSEDIFTVNGEGYNTVIQLDNQDGAEDNPLYDGLIDNVDNSNCTYPGVGIAVSANQLTLRNVYVETRGYHRPALVTYDTATDATADQSPLLIVEDSVLASWGSEGTGTSAPTFTCMYGSARPVIINASADAYFFNSQILSSDWGSYSLDQCSGVTDYIVNSFNENTVGGYGIYAIGATNTIEMYGTTSISAQYGGIICAAGTTYIHNLADALADSDLMSRYDGTMTLADALNEGGGSRMIGLNNAVTFTADMSGADVVSTLAAEDTYFSTLEEDAVTLEGEPMVSVLDSYDWLSNFSVLTNGAPYFFLNYIDGATLCYRSVNSVLELDNCELESKTGTVIQTVLGYDTSASGINVPDGTVYAGYDFTLSNMDVTGDILHEDYQRAMDLTLDHTTLNGAVVTGTMASWNEGIAQYVDQLWNSSDPAVGGSVAEAAAACGISEESVIDMLVKNDGYESFYGANLTLTNGSVWTVSDTSSLACLTIGEDCAVQAAEGKTLTVYTGVDMSNSDVAFDVTTGTKLDDLAPGTYENVILVVSGEDEASDESFPFADVASGSWYYDAVNYVWTNGLMNGTGADAFRPTAAATRGMIVTILYRMEGEPAVASSAGFSDVTAGKYYADAVAWAAEHDIVNGYEDGSFRPETAITREQLAAILYRYAAYQGLDVSAAAELSGYSDAGSVSGYALSAMQWAAAEELITGVTASALEPSGTAVRAQVAAMLMRYCQMAEA